MGQQETKQGSPSGADSEQRIHELAGSIVAAAGLELVELAYRPLARRPLLRLDIDRAGPRGVTIEECQQVSRSLASALDEADLVDGRYVLEVSSPGIDRPIRTLDDIRRNTGRRVVIATSEPIGGRRSFCGRLLGGQGDSLELADDEGGEVSIPLRAIASARQEISLTSGGVGDRRRDRVL